MRPSCRNSTLDSRDGRLPICTRSLCCSAAGMRCRGGVIARTICGSGEIGTVLKAHTSLRPNMGWLVRRGLVTQAPKSPAAEQPEEKVSKFDDTLRERPAKSRPLRLDVGAAC